MITARHVSFRRGPQVIVDEINLMIAPGEFVAIIGPNGAGKSTLLQLMTGALKPSGGEITFAGKPVAIWRKADLARRRAVLSQATQVAFPFTVEETLMLSVPDGVARTKLPAITCEALAHVGLCGFEHRVLQELSGGEQQRVHLARVLTQLEATRGTEPQTLFLDEPVAGLDLRHQIETMELVRRLAGEQVAVVAVIHDLNLVLTYASRVICIHNGRLAADGPPKQVLTPALIARVFEIKAKPQRSGMLEFAGMA